MKWLPVLIVLVMAWLACGTAEAAAESDSAFKIRTLSRGPFCAIQEPQQEVITTAAKWEELWRKLTASAKNPKEPPAVDFDREMIVFVTLGRKNTGGYSIGIARVEPVGDRLQIHCKIRAPQPGGMAIQVITAPYHVVAIPRSELKPEFIETKPDSK